jgi:hypothetical protein
MAMSWSIYKIYIEIESDSIDAATEMRGRPNMILSLRLDSDILTTNRIIDSMTNLEYNKKLIPGKHLLEIVLDGWAKLKSLSIEGRYQPGLRQIIPVDVLLNNGIVKKVIDENHHIAFEFTTWE